MMLVDKVSDEVLGKSIYEYIIMGEIKSVGYDFESYRK